MSEQEFDNNLYIYDKSLKKKRKKTDVEKEQLENLKKLERLLKKFDKGK